MTDHVKIYGIKPRIQYTADGTLTEYEFPFAIFSTSDIDVYFGDTLQDTTTYTVSEARHSDGGTVTFESVPSSGTIITIVRNLSIERTSDFQEGSTLRAKVLNDELDYQIACQQQIAENLNRSMVLPPYATDNDLDLTLPTPSAGKAIIWNSDGTNLENSEVEINSISRELDAKVSTATTQAGIATTQAQTATTQAGIATTQAQTATTQAQTATTQAGIATTKATEVSQALSTKANTGMDNLTTAGKEVVTNLSMPGYFAKERNSLTSGVWNLANKDVIVTANVGPNLQGGIFISPDAGVTVVPAIRCVAPSSGGYSGCSAFIRKGLYYQAVSNYEAYVDYLMGE